jgi:hypothetical protein
MLKTLDIQDLLILDSNFAFEHNKLYYTMRRRAKKYIGYVNNSDYIVVGSNPILNTFFDSGFHFSRRILDQITSVAFFYLKPYLDNYHIGLISKHSKKKSLTHVYADSFYYDKFLTMKVRDINQPVSRNNIFFSPELNFGVDKRQIHAVQYDKEHVINISYIENNGYVMGSIIRDFVFDLKNLDDSFFGLNKMLYEALLLKIIDLPFEDFINNFSKDNFTIIDIIRL